MIVLAALQTTSLLLFVWLFHYTTQFGFSASFFTHFFFALFFLFFWLLLHRPTADNDDTHANFCFQPQIESENFKIFQLRFVLTFTMCPFSQRVLLFTDFPTSLWLARRASMRFTSASRFSSHSLCLLLTQCVFSLYTVFFSFDFFLLFCELSSVSHVSLLAICFFATCTFFFLAFCFKTLHLFLFNGDYI